MCIYNKDKKKDKKKKKKKKRSQVDQGLIMVRDAGTRNSPI